MIFCILILYNMKFHPFLFILALLVPLATSACPSFTYLNSTCLPCSTRCTTCTSSITCSQCAPYYYVATNGTCINCPSNCYTCSSESICTSCAQPYLLVDYSCQLCSVPNAASCSSLSTVLTCATGYYSSSSFCGSCPLYCSTCMNATYCTACNSGYFLQYQNSVCTACNTCATCSGTASNCTSCSNGYYLSSSSCITTTCSISNCFYCSTNNICSKCNKNYYLQNNNCIYGSSVLCSSGALGTWPNQCQSCDTNSYSGSTSGSYSYCIPYTTLSSGTKNQFYYYMYNDYSLLFSSQSLTSSCSDQSYVLNPSSISLSIGNYYSLSLTIKGYSLSASSVLTVNLTDSQKYQLINITLTGSCQASITSITSTTLNSNPLTIQFVNATSFGLIQILITNKLCSSGCVKCLNSQLCLQCTSPNYLLNYQCVSDCGNYYKLNQSSVLSCVISCPDGFYPSTSNLECLACTLPCATCLNSTLCFSCATYNSLQYYYMSLNNTCMSSCPSKYFISGTSCSSCISPCNTCTSQTACLSCVQGYWNGTNCAATCPNGTYADSSNNSCGSCVGCLTCINSSTICTSCSSGLIMFDNSCISTCTNEYYQSGSTCLRCVSPCSSCINSTHCLSCSIGYLEGSSCISLCSQGTYGDLTTQKCLSCNTTCSSCVSSTQCTSCQTNYCLQLSSCILSSQGCLDSYYAMTTTDSVCVCTPCSYPCKLCTSQTACVSCVSGYLSGNSCIPSCPSLYYGNSSSQKCLLCSSSFSNCFQCSQFSCTSCNSSYIYNQFSTTSSGYCVSTCPDTFYNNSNSCVYCISPCNKCSSSTNCLTCISGYILSNNSCVLQCNIGYFLESTTSGDVCSPCQSPCKTCTNSTACLSCVRLAVLNAQTYLYNSSCSSCPSGYYPSLITLECENCLYPCLTCTSQSACLSCIVGFYNSTSNSCSQCSQGSYADAATSTCVKCKQNCSSCSTATDCSKCTNNTFLKSSNCLTASQCASYSGFYVNSVTSLCSSCVTPCLTCSNQTTCLSCLSGYMYFNNTCIVVCPQGYYNNIAYSICTSCPTECVTCTSSASCLTCAASYLYYKNQLACLSTCPSKTYKVSSECLDCKYPCLECSSQQSCISCQSGILLESNKSCISSCPSHYFSLNNNCEVCDSSCYQCNKMSTNCTSCSSPTFLYNNTCISTCPDSYFGDAQALTCFSCIAPCEYCSDRITCSKCSDQYSYIVALNQCTLVCPSSYFTVNNTDTSTSASKKLCVSCKTECMTCSSPSTCDLCINGYQSEGACVSSCPEKMYPQNGVCNNCSLPCYNCSSTTVCLSCPLGLGYLLVASSQCLLTNTCPFGYYLQPSGISCEINCPLTYYKQSQTRSCLIECPQHFFKGTDSTCYQSCPMNTFGNTTYYCQSCNQSCPSLLLRFSVTSEIIFDDLYLLIQFSTPPKYEISVSESQIVLSPSIDFNISSTTSDSITLQLFPSDSIQKTVLTVQFLTPFSLFSHQLPLQNPKESIIFSGYNLYSKSLINLQTLGQSIALISALICIWRGYLGLDFIQNLFLFSLVNIHYPPHLSSFLLGFKQSHFYFKIIQLTAPAKFKFRQVVQNMSLLGNSLYALILIAVVMIVSITMIIVQNIRQKKVEPANPTRQNQDYVLEDSLEPWYKRIDYYQAFKLEIPMLVFYALFTYPVLFCICQFSNWLDSNPNNSIASKYLSPFILILLIIYPICLVLIVQPRPLFYTLLLFRKLILCVCLIVAMNYPVYIFGFIAVVSLSTFVLLITHNPYKWKIQLIVNSVGQGAQFILSILFSIFTFYDQGTNTNTKIIMGFIIIAVISLGILSHVVLNLLLISCWFLKIVKGKDYIYIWSSKNEGEMQASQPQSENSSASILKMRKSNSRIGSKVLQQDVIVEVPKNEEESDRNQEIEQDPEFRVYSDNEDKTEENNNANDQPPGYLVKVVNQFEDYDN